MNTTPIFLLAAAALGAFALSLALTGLVMAIAPRILAWVPAALAGMALAGAAVLIATVAISDLSGYLAEIGGPGQTGFILYGNTHVLAHPNMRQGYKRARREPLPGLGDAGDRIFGTK